MTLLWTLLIGFLVGLVARAILPGRNPMGFFVTALLGVAGSFTASFVGRSLGWYQPGEGAGFFLSVLGAVMLLLAYGAFLQKRST